MILKIQDELRRVGEYARNPDVAFFLKKEHKDDREWWVLGSAMTILREARLLYAEFAEKTSPPEPDFVTYQTDAKDSLFKRIEITEVLSPGRRRCDEYKNIGSQEEQADFFEIVPVGEPWGVFVRRLQEKFLMRYGTNTWLIVYHNMRPNEISHLGQWHDMILKAASGWNVDCAGSIDLRKSPFEKILVIDCNGDAMVSLFPRCEVIAEEKRHPF